MSSGIDILMITHNRPAYTRLSLPRLLETCDESCRVWLWHNGTDKETLSVVRSYLDHPRVYKFHHSPENKKLREPTNWLFENSKGAYLSKVDDDCLVPHEWLSVLRRAHEDEPRFGAIGCWRFQDEDFIPELATKKIQSFRGGHQLLTNCWVEGSGYLMKRACVSRLGLIRQKKSFTGYCVRIAAAGWANGWYYPFLYQEHMDDPRAPHTLLRSDADLAVMMPLSATTFGATSLREWTQKLQDDARAVQAASVDPREYIGWGFQLRRIRTWLLRARAR